MPLASLAASAACFSYLCAGHLPVTSSFVTFWLKQLSQLDPALGHLKDIVFLLLLCVYYVTMHFYPASGGHVFASSTGAPRDASHHRTLSTARADGAAKHALASCSRAPARARGRPPARRVFIFSRECDADCSVLTRTRRACVPMTAKSYTSHGDTASPRSHHAAPQD